MIYTMIHDIVKEGWCDLKEPGICLPSMKEAGTSCVYYQQIGTWCTIQVHLIKDDRQGSCNFNKMIF